MSDNNFSEILDLQNELNNIPQNMTNALNCNLNVLTNIIRDNLNDFNSTYHTNFNDKTTDDEYQNFFVQTYIDYFQDNFMKKVDIKNEFNKTHGKYAQIL